jgi:hypothetical protein
MAFALSFFLEAYGIHLPLIAIKAQHPSLMLDGFAFTGLLLAGAGTLTFACYEIFLIPEFLKTLEIGSSLSKRAKSIFIIYHIVWCGNNSYTSTKYLTSCIYQHINYVWIYFMGSNYEIIRLW